MISKDRKMPLYHQLAELIIHSIEDKIIGENEKIPSEREYCEKYNLSRATVRQAISHLEQKGYIYKVQGKGTFVSPKIFKQNLLKFYSFTEEMKKKGKEPESKLLNFKVEKANSVVAEKLGITIRDKIYLIERLRLADAEPMMFEKTYLNYKRFPRLTKKDLVERPMYDIFLKEYDVKFTKAIEKFSVLNVNISEAKMLKISENSPCIKLQRLTYEENRVIEYTESIARGDRFEFEVELNND